jgi:hypothetical protein
MTAPKDILAGHQQEIQADRDRKIGGGEGTAEKSPPAGRGTDNGLVPFANYLGVYVTRLSPGSAASPGVRASRWPPTLRTVTRVPVG